jgi:HK97 family phage prohead protease/HK97 family phage major capsid protein
MDKTFYLSSNNFKVKAGEGEDVTSLEIEGFANTTTKDRDGDLIPAGVWEKGIQEYLKNPVLLGFHQHNNPVGRMIAHEISDKGLWIKGTISSASDKVFKLVQAGIITAFSVGFTIKNAEFKPEIDTFIITELELHEISLVSVGSNRDSLFSLSKAFNDDTDELNKFKMLFAKDSDSVKEQDTTDNVDSETNKKGIENMEEKDLELMVAKMVAASEAKAAALTAEIAEKATAEKAASADIEAKVAAAVKAATAPVIVSGETGAEKLMAEIEKRFADAEVSSKAALAGLEAELKEKAAEIAAMNKSKMTFSDTGSTGTHQEKETAVLLAKIMRKGVADTKYGSALVEKVGTHVPNATWELEVSMRMEEEVRRKLVVAPTLRQMQMQTNVMTIPVNPEAGTATWIENSQFGTSASSGAAKTHALSAITVNAYKLASLEYLPFEEQEDSLLVLLPIIRDAMVRRLARSVDIAFIRGAGAGADPVKGLAGFDAAAAVNPAVANAATIENMLAMRKDLGALGLDPSELIYVVSTDVYHDLLSDTTVGSSFRTADAVGVDRSTLLTGQIGFIGNSKVLVSAEFEAKAANKIGAIIYNPSNFIVGNQRGLRFDTDDIVVEQRKVLVASLRTGLQQLTTNFGAGVS